MLIANTCTLEDNQYPVILRTIVVLNSFKASKLHHQNMAKRYNAGPAKPGSDCILHAGIKYWAWSTDGHYTSNVHMSKYKEIKNERMHENFWTPFTCTYHDSLGANEYDASRTQQPELDTAWQWIKSACFQQCKSAEEHAGTFREWDIAFLNGGLQDSYMMGCFGCIDVWFNSHAFANIVHW